MMMLFMSDPAPSVAYGCGIYEGHWNKVLDESFCVRAHEQYAGEDIADTIHARAALSARQASVCLNGIASNEPCRPDDTLKRCTLCGFIADTKYAAQFPARPDVGKK